MASVRKVLAQASPAVTSEVTVYTCGSTLGAVVSTMMLCNLTGIAATVTINVGIAGAVSSNANTNAKLLSVPANGVLPLTIGMTLASTDVVRITTPVANSIAVTLYGVENS